MKKSILSIIAFGLLFCGSMQTATAQSNVKTTTGGTSNQVAKFVNDTIIENSQITDNGTHIGIGTTTPGAKLEIVGPVTNDVNVGVLLKKQPVDLGCEIRAEGNRMALRTYDIERVRINELGNVGIGLTNPTYKLEVAGAIRAQGSLPQLVLRNTDNSADNKEWKIFPYTNHLYMGAVNDIDNFGTNFLDVLRNGTTIVYSSFLNGDVSVGAIVPTAKFQILSSGDKGLMVGSGSVLTTAAKSLMDISGTWSGTGTFAGAIKLNVTGASANANSLLMDLQLGGASKFKVDKSGNTTIAPLAGTGSRMVQANAAGTLVPLAAGTASQVLLGTGVWGSVPAGGSNFSITGNSGTNPATNFIGTTDAQDLVFRTNNTEKVRIMSDGRIGIGTAAPDANSKLDVVGNAKISGSVTAGSLNVSGGGTPAVFDSVKVTGLSGTGNRYLVADPTGKLRLATPATSVPWETRGNNADPTQDFLGTLFAQDLVFKTNNVERMRITGIPNAGGHEGLVGIGTSTPEKALHIKTTHAEGVESHQGIRLENTVVTIDAPLPTTSVWDIDPVVYLPIGNPQTSSYQPALKIGMPGNPVMTMTETGNVGIGTQLISNPDNFKLAVNGTIGCKEVKVKINNAAWPDYVFESNHKLKTLAELEQFIKQEKHLPDMPKAKDAETGGVNVSEMITKLLKQQEELTLYIIEQNKRINELEKKANK